MAQGVAWCARAAGVPCAVVVPDHAPRAKLDAIERLGARIVPVPFERWWQVLVERGYEGMAGRFIHPVSDPAVIAGNATIGLEILEDLPAVASVLVPYGGGGLSSGIAAGVRAAGSAAPTFACEVETAAPLARRARRRRAHARSTTGRASSTASAGAACSPRCGRSPRRCSPAASSSGSRRSPPRSASSSTRARVVAEGAGAASLAAAFAGRPATGAGGAAVPRPEGPVVCVVSGGNLDPARLATILEGRLP